MRSMCMAACHQPTNQVSDNGAILRCDTHTHESVLLLRHRTQPWLDIDPIITQDLPCMGQPQTTACLQKVLHLQQIVAELELKALNRSASDLEERVACVGRSPNNFFGQQRADLRANSAGNDQPTQLICEARGILRGYTSLLHVDRSILLIV